MILAKFGVFFKGFVAGVAADAFRCRFSQNKRTRESGPAIDNSVLKSSAHKNGPSLALPSKVEEPAIVKETERAFGKKDDKRSEKEFEDQSPDLKMSGSEDNKSGGWFSSLFGSNKQSHKESAQLGKSIESEKESSGLKVPFKEEAEATMEGVKNWASDLKSSVHEKIDELQLSDEQSKEHQKLDQDSKTIESSGWFSGLFGQSDKMSNETVDLRKCIERCKESYQGSKADECENAASSEKGSSSEEPKVAEADKSQTGWFSGLFGSTGRADMDHKESAQDKAIGTEQKPSKLKVPLKGEAEETIEGAKTWFSDLKSSLKEKIDQRLPDRATDEAKTGEREYNWWFADSSSGKCSQSGEKNEDPDETSGEETAKPSGEESKSSKADGPGLFPSLFSGSNNQADDERPNPQQPDNRDGQEQAESWFSWLFSSGSKESADDDHIKDTDGHCCCNMATLYKSCQKTGQKEYKIKICGVLSVEEIDPK